MVDNKLLDQYDNPSLGRKDHLKWVSYREYLLEQEWRKILMSNVDPKDRGELFERITKEIDEQLKQEEDAKLGEQTEDD